MSRSPPPGEGRSIDAVLAAALRKQERDEAREAERAAKRARPQDDAEDAVVPAPRASVSTVTTEEVTEEEVPQPLREDTPPCSPPGPPISEAEARAEAAASAEGLILLREKTSTTGFKGVYANSGIRAKPYQAAICRNGRLETLGPFASAPEAALCYARQIGPEACAKAAALISPSERPPMTLEEAAAIAKREGLVIHMDSESVTGYKRVAQIGVVGKAARPFMSQILRGGRVEVIGFFVSAAEAALAYSRATRVGADGLLPHRGYEAGSGSGGASSS